MASVDAQKVLPYVYPDKYGVHRCGTFGDWRERLQDLATFLGYTLIAEDR